MATVHALGWLTVACGVGVLLAVMLAAPGLNRFSGPLTYGRWVPVHLNLVLYGWLALPLVALLLRVFTAERGAGLAVQAWSGSLMIGAVGWLAGETTGKAFLDWTGVSRVVFLLSQVLLAAVLAAGLVGRKARGLWVLWAGLLTVPVALGVATSPSTVHAHREPLQVAAVASLLIWAWLLPRWLRRFKWPEGSRPWLLAFLAWDGALLATAVPMFLPGFPDRIKLTNALAGQAHLAMAGAASSFAALILVVVNDRTRLRGCLGDRGSFVLWHGGNALHVATLAAVGWIEAVDPGAVFRGEMGITACYLVRTLAGVAMLAAACRWMGAALRCLEASPWPAALAPRRVLQ